MDLPFRGARGGRGALRLRSAGGAPQRRAARVDGRRAHVRRGRTGGVGVGGVGWMGGGVDGGGKKILRVESFFFLLLLQPWFFHRKPDPFQVGFRRIPGKNGEGSTRKMGLSGAKEGMQGIAAGGRSECELEPVGWHQRGDVGQSSMFDKIRHYSC